MRRVTYFGIFEPTGNGAFSVYFPDLPGCTSYGETLNEAQKNAQDALWLHLYGMEQDGDSIPAPSATPKVDPETPAGYLEFPITVFPSLTNDMDMLLEADQSFAYEFIKKLVKAWDPDYTKVTSQEAREIEEAEASCFVDETDIDWDDLSKYTE